jgi:hypothetical protein
VTVGSGCGVRDGEIEVWGVREEVWFRMRV